MKPRSLLMRFLLLWLAAFALTLAWGGINIAWTTTPLWLDSVFGCIVIVAFLRAAGPLAQSIVRRRSVRIASYFFLVLAVWTGIAWASLSLETPLFRLPSFLWTIFSKPAQVLERWVDQPLVQMKVAYQSNTGFQSEWVFQMLAGWALLALLAVFGAIALRLAWMPVWQRLEPGVLAWRAHLAYLPLRPGRWLAWVQRVLAAISILTLLLAGWGAAAAEYTPEPAQMQFFSGPARMQSVTALAVDEGGRVYAGTDRSGVYVSEDGGETSSPRDQGIAANASVNSM